MNRAAAPLPPGRQPLFWREGVTVQRARVGRGAIAAIGVYRPQAVVLVIGPPDMSGFDVYDATIECWPDMPVVFSTGHEEERGNPRWRDKKRVEFLMKPYGTGDLIAALESVCA